MDLLILVARHIPLHILSQYYGGIASFGQNELQLCPVFLDGDLRFDRA
jgi:hypothetical protein